MRSKIRVVIVGGGVIGLALAWRLRQGGAAVTVVERGECGRGATAAAAGLLQAAPVVAEGTERSSLNIRSRNTVK